MSDVRHSSERLFLRPLPCGEATSSPGVRPASFSSPPRRGRAGSRRRPATRASSRGDRASSFTTAPPRSSLRIACSSSRVTWAWPRGTRRRGRCASARSRSSRPRATIRIAPRCGRDQGLPRRRWLRRPRERDLSGRGGRKPLGDPAAGVDGRLRMDAGGS